MGRAARRPGPVPGAMRHWQRAALALAGSAALGLFVAFAIGATLDLSRWRDAAAQQASTALGRSVGIHGHFQLSLGRQLRLRIGDVRIANPPGFGTEEFVAVGEATLRIDLVDALRGKLRLHDIDASDVRLRLERDKDGRGNWSPPTPREETAPRAVIAIERIAMHRVAVHFRDHPSAKYRSIELDALSGSLAAAADEIALTGLQGVFGESGFSGHLTISLTAPRPRLESTLSIASLDLGTLAPSDPQRDEVQAWRTLALRELVPADLELDLNVSRLLGLPLAIDDAKLALRADVRGVHAPLSATLAGTVLSGQFDLDLAAPTPTLALRLDARDVGLDALQRDLPGQPVLEGRLEGLGLRLSGRGGTPDAVLRDLELTLAMAAAQVSYRHADAAQPIAFTLSDLQLEAQRGERLHGSARASLLDQETRLSVRAGTLPEMLRERRMPVELELVQTRASLRLDGVLDSAGAAPGTALGFALKVRNAGELARWLPVAPQSRLPIAARGQLRMSPEAWLLEQATLELGRSRLRVDARRTRDRERPLTTARVRGSLIDVPQLSALVVGARPAVAAGTGLDTPMLAGTIDLADADLDMHLQRVALGRAELADVALAVRTREGRLLPARARGKLAGVPFAALVEFDATDAPPSARLDLSARDIDAGALLRTLGLTEDIDARTDSLELALRARGRSLRELGESTVLEMRLAGGHLRVPGAAQRPAADILMHDAIVEAAPGQPVRLRIDGVLEQAPVSLRLSTAPLADFAGGKTRVPFAMEALAAETRLGLEGEVGLPLGSGGKLIFAMSGQRLDALNDLARVELPAWGPWSLRGPLRMGATGYDVEDLRLDIGQSSFSGSGRLDLNGPRPHAELKVTGKSIQLDDFPIPERMTDPPDWSGGLRGASAPVARRIDRLLSARFLRRLDATIEVRADEVLAGSDRMADGALHMTLRDGRLNLDPVVLNLPGGGMRLSMAYDIKDSAVDYRIAADIERFDYGIIARRLRRADNESGLFSLNLDISGQAPSLDAIMKKANGKLDVAVWPIELRSGVFNLWSANMVLTLVPLIDPGRSPQINCVVARFDVKDGYLADDKFLIDTTRMRITGTVQANLQTEELAAVFRPRAKGLGLFRLQTPLRVSGTLTDQRFGATPLDFLLSGVRMIASPILVPIERLTLGPLPRDGADVCTDPLRASGE